MDALYVKSLVLSTAHYRQRFREDEATKRKPHYATTQRGSENSDSASGTDGKEFRNDKHIFATQLLLHVGGTSGSGKSTLAHHLAQELRQICGSPNKVLVVAPTKRAAAAIGGVTIYTALSLSVMSVFPKRSVKFSNHPRNQPRHSSLEWLIFDDVCVVSAELLNELHYVLCHSKNCSAPFGGVNAVIIGDLFHLPPVNGSKIFEATYWKQFRYVYLEKRFRSRHDRTLTRICDTLNFGSLKYDETAKNALLSRRMPFLSSEEIEEFNDALHLFPGKAAAAAMNCSRATNADDLRAFLSHDIFLERYCSAYCRREARNNESSGEVLDVESSSSSDVESSSSSSDVESSSSSDVSTSVNDVVIYDTKFGNLVEHREYDNYFASRISWTRKTKMCQKDVHGLSREIVIRVGDVVFFQTDVEFEKEGYLVNEGATGTVIEINPYITVSLYLCDIGKRVRVNVGQVSVIEQISDNLYLRRTQIPFTVKRASTIHSVQGLTLNRVILHFNRLFCPSLAYAALAAVQKLNDIMIAELNVQSLLGNAPCAGAQREFQRLSSIREKMPFYVKNVYRN